LSRKRRPGSIKMSGKTNENLENGRVYGHGKKADPKKKRGPGGGGGAKRRKKKLSRVGVSPVKAIRSKGTEGKKCFARTGKKKKKSSLKKRGGGKKKGKSSHKRKEENKYGTFRLKGKRKKNQKARKVEMGENADAAKRPSFQINRRLSSCQKEGEKIEGGWEGKKRKSA